MIPGTLQRFHEAALPALPWQGMFFAFIPWQTALSRLLDQQHFSPLDRRHFDPLKDSTLTPWPTALLLIDREHFDPVTDSTLTPWPTALWPLDRRHLHPLTGSKHFDSLTDSYFAFMFPDRRQTSTSVGFSAKHSALQRSWLFTFSLQTCLPTSLIHRNILMLLDAWLLSSTLS